MFSAPTDVPTVSLGTVDIPEVAAVAGLEQGLRTGPDPDQFN